MMNRGAAKLQACNGGEPNELRQWGAQACDSGELDIAIMGIPTDGCLTLTLCSGSGRWHSFNVFVFVSRKIEI